jgi:subfamily B ATP-binding cassette protein MsbA
MILSALSGLLEGLGVSMLFPLLESLYKQDHGKSTFDLDLFNEFFQWLHIEQSTFVLLVIFVSSFILKSSFKYFVGIYKTKLSTDMLKNIRLDFLKDFLDLDYKAYMFMDAGKVSNTFTLELEKTMSGFIYFCNYFVGLFTGLAFLVLVCCISLAFTLLIILVGVFYFILFSKINQSINLFSKSIAQKNSWCSFHMESE